MATKLKRAKPRKLPDEIPALIGMFRDQGGALQFYRKSETPDEYAARCRAYKLNTTPEQRMRKMMVGNPW